MIAMSKELPDMVYITRESENPNDIKVWGVELANSTTYLRQDLIATKVENLNPVNIDFGILRACIDGKREPFEGIGALERIAVFINKTRRFEKEPKRHGSFLSGERPEGKFSALYSDGSGSRLFMTVDGSGYPAGHDGYMDGESGDNVDFDWFADAGFSQWVRLPDDYNLWIERN